MSQSTDAALVEAVRPESDLPARAGMSEVAEARHPSPLNDARSLEIVVECAKKGEPGAANLLLSLARLTLRSGRTLPSVLSKYLQEALAAIAGGTRAGLALHTAAVPGRKRQPVTEKLAREIEVKGELMERAMAVLEGEWMLQERKRGDPTLEQLLVEEVATSRGVSDRTTRRIISESNSSVENYLALGDMTRNAMLLLLEWLDEVCGEEAELKPNQPSRSISSLTNGPVTGDASHDSK